MNERAQDKSYRSHFGRIARSGKVVLSHPDPAGNHRAEILVKPGVVTGSVNEAPLTEGLLAVMI